MDTQSNCTFQSPSSQSMGSKSGSSKSGESSIGKGKEEDLTKDNAASPIDLECQIQAERITKLFTEAIYKTKLSICLPMLVQENRTLNSVLTRQHFEDLIFIFEQYDNPLFSTSLLNVSAMDDVKGGDISLKNRLNPELSHVIYILTSYIQLRETVDAMIDQMKSKYSLMKTRPLSPGLEYLMLLEHFRDLMLEQMTRTAADELAAKIRTRKLEKSNAQLIENIKEYTKTLKEEHEQFERTMELKSEIIAKLQQEVSILDHDAKIKRKKKILDSDRQMVLATRAHTVKYDMLKEEEVEVTERYQDVLRRHLKDEKNQRTRRLKVETQLQSWLQKYDLEMGDKQLELDEFHEKFEDESQKVEALEEKLAEQDKEYVPLMEERETEYHQEMTEKMNKFLIEHAARVIQVAWRDVLANRAEKKKLKKIQKKMQAAAAAAEKKGGKK